ncbi:MAG: hypothetical protein B6D39_01030 [Anaerolineae bacterium UTCFX2]|jgi:4'-phosphopantetheinyl transferase|nr:4'-phosphopantetheinyl transferase superfamily protein [Anaerolineae bacterium]OQY94662.1 MAG: hypothetical protein B6D39_01030 [Anaerolineae bacterium UTCFX2]
MTLADQRSFWLVPPAKMNLEANQVHLWRAGLSRDPAAQQAAWAVLSDDERARAYRYRNDEDREHFIARRGILRALLGSYLKIPAAEVKFVYNPYGKPSLAAVSTIDPLQFNLSHSNGMALFGFAWSTRVGVDLERIQPDRGVLELAEKYLSINEREYLAQLAPGAQTGAFFRCWTRKEALLKAQGAGLLIPPEQIEVSFGSDQPAQILAIRGGIEPLDNWYLQNVDFDEDHAAALVVERQAFSTCCWDYSLQG